MRVPPINIRGLFGVRNNTHSLKQNPSQTNMIKPIECDTVSFSSMSRYYMLYSTLPGEIKNILKPEDSISMFQNMEDIADGISNGRKLAMADGTAVYDNPWLDNYYIMISKDLDDDTRVVYTKTNMGDLIWQDPRDRRIQLIKKGS